MPEDVRVAAFLRAAPGQEDAVREAALACVAPTRAEPDNAIYILHCDTREPALFALVEHWKSQQALDQHMHLTGAIEAYEAFDKREAGWIKTELYPQAAA